MRRQEACFLRCIWMFFENAACVSREGQAPCPCSIYFWTAGTREPGAAQRPRDQLSRESLSPSFITSTRSLLPRSRARPGVHLCSAGASDLQLPPA